MTQSLLAQIANRRIANFVTRWDEVEALVVRVYRAGEATDDDEAAYSRNRAWLLERYPRWRTHLIPYWQKTTIAGEEVTFDPFEVLLAATRANVFLDNWAAMQTLPAAREALNGWLADLIAR